MLKFILDFGVISLAFMTVTALVFGILALKGKDMILDNEYIKASKEKRETMDKKAYRTQGAIICFFLAAISLFNLLRALTSIDAFTYVAAAVGAVGAIYAIVSHYSLKKKSR